MYPHGLHRPIMYHPPQPRYPRQPYYGAVGLPPYAAIPHPPPYFGHPPMMPAAPPAHAVQLQPVTAANFAAELDLIGFLLPAYPYVVVDTEYPGTVHRPPAAGRRDSDLSPDERYAVVKSDVDELPVVQLGVTLCDAHGNMPFVPGHGGYGYGYGYGYYHGGLRRQVWEVHFGDFDVGRDRHAEKSLEFLREQGVDFKEARARGVGAAAFGAKLAEVLSSAVRRGGGGGNNGGVELTWVAFGGAYDLAYLVKMLDGGRPLPETRQGFMARVRELLGGRVFDAKVMADSCGRGDLRGVGIRSVAANLGIPSPAEHVPWLAGMKSLTAYWIHTILKLYVLSKDAAASFEGLVDGLQ